MDNNENNLPSKKDQIEDTAEQTEKAGEKRSRRPRKKLVIILGSVAAALLILALSAYLVVHSYLSKINYDKGEKSDSTGTVVGIPKEDDPATFEPSEELDEAGKKIDENLKREMEARENVGDVTNILLVGSDTRYTGGAGRSDTMLILTVNHTEKTISLTSLLRDMYVYIPGYYNTRINAAFALEGANLLMDTIEQNFHIEIDNYAAIDFFSFVDAIDALGGITVDISYNDSYGVNRAIANYNRTIGMAESDGKLTGYGEDMLLTGKQALGYVRNRTYPTGDFVRTEHQRVFLKAVFDKVKQADLAQLDAVLNAVLPGITTDMTELELLSWITLLPSVLKYDLSTHRIPLDDTYSNLELGGALMLSVDFDANIQELQRIIYGKEAVAKAG